MTRVIVMRVGKDRKGEWDSSLEVRFSARLNIRGLNALHPDRKKINTCASGLAYLL